jgi:hypothetical protein
MPGHGQRCCARDVEPDGGTRGTLRALGAEVPVCAPTDCMDEDAIAKAANAAAGLGPLRAAVITYGATGYSPPATHFCQRSL